MSNDQSCKMKTILSGNKGLTLIEILVVLTILTLIAGLIAPRIMGKTDEAKRKAAYIQMKNLEGALKMYKLDQGHYPTTDLGLEALINPPASNNKSFKDGGYLESTKVPLDPWGNPFVYISPGNYNKDYDMMSLGADNSIGGEGNDADIKSWELD